MTTTNKTPIVLALDATGSNLIKAVGSAGEAEAKATGKKTGATQKAADYLFSALGWRTETIRAKVEANKARRDSIREMIVAGFSVEKQKLLSYTGEALKGLSDEKKKMRRDAMQSTGAYFALIEKAIKANEDGLLSDAEQEAKGKEEKAKNTEFAKIQKALQTALDILQKMESAPEGVDLLKAVERVKALKGGLPSI